MQLSNSKTKRKRTSAFGAKVSIIMPLYNAQEWLDECIQSVCDQTFSNKVELSMYNDGSTDESMTILDKWSPVLMDRNIYVTLSGHDENPKGVGHAKNCAVKQSCSDYLCFLDSDDVMLFTRLDKQLEAAHELDKVTIIGCRFHRKPEDSTIRYTKWANSLSESQLYTQIYTSHGPTLIMPTWFCHRQVFDNVGGFDESGKGTPEDLIFFFEHLRLNGKLARVDEDLLMYRYHPKAATFSVHEDTIWSVRIKEIQARVVSVWEHFTIWNAGKQGRKFYRSLDKVNKDKVQAFCDVDDKKINKGFYTYEESKEVPKPKIPIVHFTQATKPFIICVKLDLTKGGFEQNLNSLNLVEGVDYFYFS